MDSSVLLLLDFNCVQQYAAFYLVSSFLTKYVPGNVSRNVIFFRPNPHVTFVFVVNVKFLTKSRRNDVAIRHQKTFYD